MLGGTFDPIHCGHIQVGNQASRDLDSAIVRLMPAKEPRLRDHPAADVFDRWTMVQLACETEPKLVACDLEIREDGPTRTIDTLQQIVDATGTHVVWVLSTDALAQMPRWYRYTEIPRLSSLFVFRRPGFPSLSLPSEFKRVSVTASLLESAGLIYISAIDMPRISGTEIRQRVRAGEDVSRLLPASVHKHIIGRGLYR